MQCFTFRDVGKRCINAVKFYGPQIDYALSETSNAMNGKHGGKIDAIRKPKAILFFTSYSLATFAENETLKHGFFRD